MRVATEHSSHAETATVGVWIDAGGRSEGTSVDGKLHGPSCKLTFSDGTDWSGEMKNGIPWNGAGVWVDIYGRSDGTYAHPTLPAPPSE